MLEQGHSGNHGDGLGQEWPQYAGDTEHDVQAPLPASEAGSGLVRLPWDSPEGNPAFALCEPDGTIARFAAQAVETRITIAHEVMRYARMTLSDEHDIEPVEARFLVARLSECVSDLLAALGRQP